MKKEVTTVITLWPDDVQEVLRKSKIITAAKKVSHIQPIYRAGFGSELVCIKIEVNDAKV